VGSRQVSSSDFIGGAGAVYDEQAAPKEGEEGENEHRDAREHGTMRIDISPPAPADIKEEKVRLGDMQREACSGEGGVAAEGEGARCGCGHALCSGLGAGCWLSARGAAAGGGALAVDELDVGDDAAGLARPLRRKCCTG
jgi:hypothetical protein